MKTLISAFTATLAITMAASAAPRLVVSTPSLVPESQIDLVLDLPAAEISELGETVANTWLEIQPALPGKLLWKAQNVIQFIPDQVPVIGMSYTFAMPKNRFHCDKSPVPAGKITTLTSEPFRVVMANLQNRWNDNYSPSKAEWLIVFNDAVDPTMAANFISFNSKSGLSIPAKLERPTLARAGSFGSTYKMWSSRFPGTPEPVGTPQDPAANVLVATPASPLPPGDGWRMITQLGLPNESTAARTTEDNRYEIGTIEPFKVTKINAIVTANEPRKIAVEFNQSLAPTLPADFLANCITCSPRPQNLSASVVGKLLYLTGDLSAADEYTLTFQPPFTSGVDHPLIAPFTEKLVFERLEPELILPSNNEAQLANGSRTYRVQTVNLTSLRVRIKKLAGTDLIRAYQGYRSYTGIGHNGENLEPLAPLPYSLVGGETVLDKEIALGNPADTSKEIVLDWNELLPKELHHTALFLDIVGTHQAGSRKQGRQNAQALLQLTDIGLAWKVSAKEALIFAFSCDTGVPLPGVKVDIFGEDAAVLQSVTTDDSGRATLPRPATARHLQAALGTDHYLTAFDSTLSTVGLWHFPIRYSYLKSAETTRKAFLFTDRSLYRPGETVRLKGIVRTQRGNDVEPATAGPARIVIIDPTDKEIHSSPVQISARGAFEFTYTLPTGKTGSYQIRLEYPEELAQAAALEEEWEKQEAILQSARFELPLRVEDFRRNAFEVAQAIAPAAPAATRLTTDLAATYYQGQPVAGGKVKYFSRITAQNPYPERFRDFLFGNHRTDDWSYWYHYFGYRPDSGEEGAQASQTQGETLLSAEGKATLTTEIPQAEFPTAREVTLSSEVTDANNQTLTATTTTTVHPASVYIGVSRNDNLIRTGNSVPLRIVATDTAGEPFKGALKITATLTRELNSAVKSRTDAGAATTRNDVTEETVFTSELTLDPAASVGPGTPLDLTPKANGRHFLTLRGTDPEGRTFSTVTYFYVYGTDEFPWQYEDGLRVKLVAEKKSYKPGETARILVLSPIEGTALVTVEREKVLRSFLVQLKTDKPVIEIPLTEADAPNAYISVLIIKGAKESARKHPEPQLRLGYCELTVENLRDSLAVNLAPGAATHRPGDEVTLTGSVAFAGGQPAADAEVTLYAEDEGTLAVMGYETPKPMNYFYQPRLLDIESGTSFETFISENPEEQYFSNKGFFIGGGGDMSKLADLLRKNFDPCATWAPALVTDASGKFTHTFKLPDTLTRYRLIAIAHHAAARFGHTESTLIAKKDLMLEPKTPRFANQSDTFQAQVLVQNASTFTGTWEIKFRTTHGPETPCASPTGPVSETLTLAPGASATVVFPTRADHTGEAVLTFQATPISLVSAELTADLTRNLSDAVESRFPVQYPMPLLRQAKLIHLQEAGKTINLRDQLDRSLLDGTGEIDLEFCTSPLVEAAASIDYLLQYPYGCVEQTTSSLIPWLAVKDLSPVIPKFAKLEDRKVAAAIQAGADRLVSMQLPDGAFGYWPGAKEAVSWATAYAGMGLMLAVEKGAQVPDSAILALKKNLVASLRGIATEKSPSALEIHARGLWVLALAGESQPAYQNLLVDRIAELTPSARCLLATAIATPSATATDEDNQANLAIAKSILNSKVPLKLKDDAWMPWSAAQAYQLIAWLTIDPTSPQPTQALDRMLRERNPYGEWQTTWVNGWSLIAMAKYAKNSQLRDEPTQITQITLGPAGASETLTLHRDTAAASRSFKLTPALNLEVNTDVPAFVRVNISAKPQVAPLQPVATNGLSIDRIYERINDDGSATILTEPKVGELIRVSLRVTLPQDQTRYLVIEDPLPSLFETVNSDFDSQRAAVSIGTSQGDFNVSHTELRTDRASFFLDEVAQKGTYTLTYLARCTLAGQATAPPAKVESMYDPENFALSASRIFTIK